ncbi:dihydrolipoyllysine-residue succinyltransferase [Candidatus Karelsulcia muelleri]|uniref:Dihydrolipoyllysine-residue succinyltransferase n=1 Tax=Candidatus Karelsulcia muelleri PSPU TaxID=1189303 RepID=A0AAD1AZV9_9FLAO|nr:dihydrolipoyllysine-residue succinyltransferase [Candidatus Karelsulcia muelleri]NJJ98698.1 dihydrolipoyllysine-residue succinyltransferase [Candidatus Karelsulcia muelleri]BAO66351.1 2-oxoglutarate dehydrogenase, E2 component [Candidatus Karelsulcia muelleri PSPU]
MILEIKVPSPGESITEVEISSWLVKNGDFVKKNQVIAEIDSDKATLEICAEESGMLIIKAKKGDILKVGEILCLIDTSFSKEKRNFRAPSTIKILNQYKIEKKKIISTVKNKKDDALKKIPSMGTKNLINRSFDITKLSKLRRKLSERLVSVKNETAMLTTFNEVDMSNIFFLRKKYKNIFKEKHGVKLGFMSFFVKSCIIALKKYPDINSMIDGENKINFKYYDISIAVSGPKGLMVPVIRNADTLSFRGIEKTIKNLSNSIKNSTISIDDITGGTFTITNGGIFGSMLSTPIINPPQSAILGMHNIVERPIVKLGKIEIRPIMYLALSYDHRLIDGKEAVGFLLSIKESIENPIKNLIGSEENLKNSFELK